MKKIILSIYFLAMPCLGFAGDTPLTWFLFHENPAATEGDKENGRDDMVTDKLIISDSKILDNNKVEFIGTYHSNLAAEGSYLLCQEFNNPDLYTCVTKKEDNQFVTFDISIIKNSEIHSYVSSGSFGTGLTFDKSRVVNDSQKYPVKGYLELEPGTAAIYNKKDTENGDETEENGELDIPGVDYDGFPYRVILEDNKGDLTFKLKMFVPLVTLIDPEADYKELKLEIPVVEYNGSKYSVVLLNTPDEQGNFEFTLQEATRLPE